jgi:hypothetical protein
VPAPQELERFVTQSGISRMAQNFRNSGVDSTVLNRRPAGDAEDVDHCEAAGL